MPRRAGRLPLRPPQRTCFACVLRNVWSAAAHGRQRGAARRKLGLSFPTGRWQTAVGGVMGPRGTVGRSGYKAEGPISRRSHGSSRGGLQQGCRQKRAHPVSEPRRPRRGRPKEADRKRPAPPTPRRRGAGGGQCHAMRLCEPRAGRACRWRRRPTTHRHLACPAPRACSGGDPRPGVADLTRQAGARVCPCHVTRTPPPGLWPDDVHGLS